nr:caspase family protein [uncultured Dongia sp.]
MKGYLHRLFAGAFLVAVALLPAPADAESTRVALVIGNGDYDASLGRLRNPANDAKLMARSLKKLGFEVSLAIDIDQKEMKRRIRDFGEALSGAGPNAVGLFYYAGHGLQVDGENFLLPVSAQIEAERDVELEAVSANAVLAQMQYGNSNGVNLVFLDACRNNPLSRGFRSATRGLARVDAPRGSFVGYSTAPGEVSVDGEGDNSPYTLALTEELLRPGEAIEEVHRAVRLKVLAATSEQQTPWDSSSLTATVILAGAAQPAIVAQTPAPAPAAVVAAPSSGSHETENLYWQSVLASNNPAMFQAYLKKYPNGQYADLAVLKLEELSGKMPSNTDSAMAAAAPAPAPVPAVVTPAAPAAKVHDFGIIEMNGAYIADKNANIRAEPNTKAKIVGKLTSQQSVIVTGRTQDAAWLQVASAAGPGYVSAQLLKTDPSVALRTPAPTPEPEPMAPAPKANALRLSDKLRPEIEKYLANSAKQKGNYRFLAVNAAGDKLGLSIGCKIQKTSWGGWAAEGCGEEADARQLAIDTCGSDCRVIFKGAEKVGDFEIDWVKNDGSTEPADLVAAAPEGETPESVNPGSQPEESAEPAAVEIPVKTASAAPEDDSVMRISESLRPKIEQYLANSESQTGNYRFLALNQAGDKLGLSIGCKIKKTSWGGWASEGCGDEAAAARLAVDTCGSDCRIIFKGAEKVGRFEIEWY